MAKSKYVDTAAIVNVIGNIYNNPNLLDMEDKYFFYEEDFPEEMHKVLFGSIYNLHILGAKEITSTAIEDYLEQRPKSLAVYKANKGAEYLQEVQKAATFSTFGFYYNRMKKMTLLRMYDKVGVDVSWIYDADNIFDAKKKQAQEDWLDNTPIEEIAEKIDSRISEIREKYAENSESNMVNAGAGAKELIARLKETPEVGYPLYGPLINTVTRGARLKKFYLRSAATGVGKTRSMIADVCSIACDEFFSPVEQKWIKNGTREPAIYITTEQEVEEVQTMMLAFLSDVEEEHILNGYYGTGEEERVLHAAELLERCPLFVEQLPDFSLADIENTIKRGIREHKARYVFFDYIHTSMKILSEISSKAGVKGLREDNILFMISIRLKDLCNQYGIFIMTSTQLNSDYRTADTYDQNLLRGAKSIADKIDYGAIMLEVSQADLAALEPLLKGKGFETPVVKMSVYKNRRGRYKDILLWCRARRGVCKIEPLFVTNYQYELIDIPDIKIDIKPHMEATAF